MRALFSGSSEIQSGCPGGERGRVPGCLVPGSPFAFLILSPPLTIFFFLMCLLGWLETEVEVDLRVIELGQFLPLVGR